MVHIDAFGRGFQAAPDKDTELLRACDDFRDAHAELDRLLASDSDLTDPQLFLLHKRWSDAGLKAASLAATTPEGRQAKAAMLLAVMDVVLGPNGSERDLHDVLAASLARDCSRPLSPVTGRGIWLARWLREKRQRNIGTR